MARVAWTHRKASGEIEAGIEFSSEENFWGLAWESRQRSAQRLGSLFS